MNRIEDTLNQLKEKKEKTFIYRQEPESLQILFRKMNTKNVVTRSWLWQKPLWRRKTYDIADR